MITGNVNPDNEFGRVSVQNCRIKVLYTLDGSWPNKESLIAGFTRSYSWNVVRFDPLSSREKAVTITIFCYHRNLLPPSFNVMSSSRVKGTKEFQRRRFSIFTK